MQDVRCEHVMGVKICSGIKFKYGINMIEGKSIIKYVKFDHKEVL